MIQLSEEFEQKNIEKQTALRKHINDLNMRNEFELWKRGYYQRTEYKRTYSTEIFVALHFLALIIFIFIIGATR